MPSSQESLAVLFPDAGFFRWSPRCPLAYPRPGTGRCPGCTNGVTGQSGSDFKPDNLEIFSAWTGLDLPTPSNHTSWFDVCCTWCGDGRDLDFNLFSMRSGSETRRGWSGRTVPGPVLMTFFGWFWLGISEDVTKSVPSQLPSKLYKAENLKIRHVLFSEQLKCWIKEHRWTRFLIEISWDLYHPEAGGRSDFCPWSRTRSFPEHITRTLSLIE